MGVNLPFSPAPLYHPLVQIKTSAIFSEGISSGRLTPPNAGLYVGDVGVCFVLAVLHSSCFLSCYPPSISCRGKQKGLISQALMLNLPGYLA